MKAHLGWSYREYKNYFAKKGDIYICRIAPTENTIQLDWYDIGKKSYNVYYRKRDDGDFILSGSTSGETYTIKNLECDTDYEFYVEAEGKKSNVRLARCGESFGSVVNYLHPDDEEYSFSGRYLCSPSLVRHPEGYLLASMDLYAGQAPQNLTLIFRSDDDGKTWKHVSELFPCFWGKMFIYQDELYMLSVSTEYGDLLIGKSTDGGKTFTEPVTLFRGNSGKPGTVGVHKNPQPVVEFNGRIWNTMEYGSWGFGRHDPMVMSAEIGSDLLDPNSWLYSEPVAYDSTWEGIPQGKSTGNIEGTLVVKDGVMYNVMRYDMTSMTPNYGKVVAYRVDTENPENAIKYDHCIDFPANHSKFSIKYDERTGKYYSIATRIYSSELNCARNLLSLMSSEDLENWTVVCDIMDKRDCDSQKIGFQYVDFIIEGDKILYLCRTAMNNAENFHDCNYSIFGEIELK